MNAGILQVTVTISQIKSCKRQLHVTITGITKVFSESLMFYKWEKTVATTLAKTGAPIMAGKFRLPWLEPELGPGFMQCLN